MNTNRLQAFAAESRTELMTSIAVRMRAALEPFSRARADQPDVVARLEEIIREEGGGDTGFAAVTERYAYRWFNRIIALRYMDVLGYTDSHVVSAEDVADVNGLPQVLSEALRGVYDPAVFEENRANRTAGVRGAVEALIDGTRASDDPQGEAYGLLLQAYCRHWHDAIPSMFEGEENLDRGVDELLMPADLLASGSVLRRALEAMTPEDCITVDEAGERHGNVEIIGWLYQFYISQRKDEVMAGFKKRNKAGAAEIPAATQLFTPDWIVRYLVQNTVGRLWARSHPESRLPKQWEYYITPSTPSDKGAATCSVTGGETDISPASPVTQNEPARSVILSESNPSVTQSESNPSVILSERSESKDLPTITSPEDLTVCDPACGSGHMLTYAFDLLYDIYEEQGYSPNEIPVLILEHNLYGMEIDERAANLAEFALLMKARDRYRRFFRRNRGMRPHIRRIEKVSFTEDEVSELNRMYQVEFDPEIWNTYAQADITGSLIQPPADLANLAVSTKSAPSDEASLAPAGGSWPGEAGPEGGDAVSAQPMLLSSDTLIDHETLARKAKAVLIQTRYLACQYMAVVANPPYMGNNNMGPELKDYVNHNYKDGKADLMACFYYRYGSLTDSDGLFGTVIGDTWMFIKSFEAMRNDLIHRHTISSFVHIRDISNHPDIFGANAAFIVEARRASHKTRFIKLSQNGSSRKKAEFLQIMRGGNQEATFTVSQSDFTRIPGSPIVYWLSDAMRATFTKGKPLGNLAQLKHGMSTGNNNTLLRQWHEVSYKKFIRDCKSRDEASKATGWFPYNKGGEFRKWYGNQQFVIRYDSHGQTYMKSLSGFRHDGRDYYFRPSVSWSFVSSAAPAFRYYPSGFVFDVAGSSIFASENILRRILGIENSTILYTQLTAIAPTVNFQVGQIASLPIADELKDMDDEDDENVEFLISTSKSDWDSYETSWDFASLPIVGDGNSKAPHQSMLPTASPQGEARFDHSQSAALTAPASGGQGRSLAEIVAAYIDSCKTVAEEQRQHEIRNNELVADAYGVRDEVPCDVPLERVSLKRNPAFAYPKADPAERDQLMARYLVKELISYAVGCMFGRYSLDKPGLVLASQGQTLDDYLREVPDPRFMPDEDNVIPVTADEWFEDDIVSRFRRFLSVVYGEERLSENVAYIESMLGKTLRKYFVNDFYADHVKTYKSRPIYWMYSSRRDNKGSFKALVYLHRYTPQTTSNVLGYLRDYVAKLDAQSSRLLASDLASDVRAGERMRTAITECREYEDKILYPLATRNLDIDLDDGVLVNYLRLGDALRAIPALERKRKDVATWTWPHHGLNN
ncbi:BREX-1 system adenine-specific DNA-methyltransferase PglX [Bifidobacterium sp. 82T24]|uniref:BREX-1 system adenine-specific DNA-methyltransferase PglX n=1 Tax=Bifidobacterium pluvialisilvae TaxID=2834436 RepID=UPI001C56184F|nr:BREX-1 system adenine-specific DNA-methyltransferase PglX [Bifidobacterium pluvialisilvae]MBW3088264.1 BREX-1 system adenine-specific DNA-methyltransferase PglX [Bifidobacterium pluvialisilvae]